MGVRISKQKDLYIVMFDDNYVGEDKAYIHDTESKALEDINKLMDENEANIDQFRLFVGTELALSMQRKISATVKK